MNMNLIVLNCPIAKGCHGLGDAQTVRDFFINAMVELWNEGEGFSGKRPFGDSGWDYEIAKSLVAAGIVEGKLDEEGYLDSVSDGWQDLVLRAVQSMGAV